MTESGAHIGQVGSPERARRAPFAAVAALAVMAGGAAFLAFAMSRPTAGVEIAEVASATAAPTPQSAAPAPPVQPVQKAPPLAAPIAAAPNKPDALEAAFGGPLRVNPARLGSTDGARAEAPVGASVLSFASPWLASDADRPPPFFFASDIEARDAASDAGRASSDGDIADGPRETRVTLAKGETFVDALRRAGVRAEDRNAAAYAFGAIYNLRRLRPGQEFVLTLAEPYQTLFQALSEGEPPPAHLLALDFRADAEKRIIISRSPDGGFRAAEKSTPLMKRVAAIRGRIEGSLYLSAKRQGAPDEVIAGLAQIFAYDVDFQREILGGDEFEAIFEVRFDEAGRLVGGGEILYGRLNWRGRKKEKGYYRFAAAGGGGRGDYFDAAGESARRLLMKTPIDGARLSSGFGTRKHPILGYQKAHKGVDFAAPRGTPIMAAGDGVIERAGPYGSFGNYIRIRHAQGYKTAYAHLNGIKKGVRTGVRVRQGDVIGYVGTTGRSTGPHLHYEVHLMDRAVNPQSLKIATGVNLGGNELAQFREVRDAIDAMRTPMAEETAPKLARENKSDASL